MEEGWLKNSKLITLNRPDLALQLAKVGYLCRYGHEARILSRLVKFAKRKIFKRLECQLVRSFLFLNQIQLKWNFKKRPSSKAVEIHRKRVGLRRKTFFVQGRLDNCKNRKKTRSNEWKRDSSII